MFLFNVDKQMLRTRPFGQLNLNFHILNRLRPVVLVCRCTVVCANFLIDFEFGLVVILRRGRLGYQGQRRVQLFGGLNWL